jgi:hypothetical protein
MTISSEDTAAAEAEEADAVDEADAEEAVLHPARNKIPLSNITANFFIDLSISIIYLSVHCEFYVMI